MLPSTHSSCPAWEGALGGKWRRPAAGHAAASPSLLPWRAGEGAGRLCGFGGRSGSWEKLSPGCLGRGEHSRLRHATAPSPAVLSFPLRTSMPGNPFGRCRQPQQCQASCFPPSPANQGFLPPLSAQPALCSLRLRHRTQRGAHRLPLPRAWTPQTVTQHGGESGASTRAQAASPSTFPPAAPRVRPLPQLADAGMHHSASSSPDTSPYPSSTASSSGSWSHTPPGQGVRIPSRAPCHRRCVRRGPGRHLFCVTTDLKWSCSWPAASW